MAKFQWMGILLVERRGDAMRQVNADAYSKAMQDYFKNLIENHKYDVDAVDCNADLQRLLERQATVNGWIPCDERYPDTEHYILLSFANFSVPCVGRYEENEEGGAFYVGDDDESCISHDLIVNAWMPLPECYADVSVQRT